VTTHRSTAIALAAGPIAALVVGVATASIRDQVGATNVGIMLAIAVVAAALVSRAAGVMTAVVAALAFNFFHAKPYHSLRIDEPRDVAIVALLVVLGLAVSDISAWRRRRELIRQAAVRAHNAPAEVDALMAGVHHVRDVWPAVVGSVLDQLGLADCGVVTERPEGLPQISRTAGRNGDGRDTFVLPAKGASIPILAAERTLGHLIVLPPPGSTSLEIERRVIVAFADHIAIALTCDRDPRTDQQSGAMA
jgi:hypothetical protein